MRYRSIHESSWGGTFNMTVECSNCGMKIQDPQRRRKTVYCQRCAHKFRPLPLRLSNDKIVETLNAANNPVNPVNPV